MKHDGHFVANCAVRAHLIVVSTPSLAFSPRLVEAQEPVGVQALGAELAVQALDESVVGRLAWPAEVQCDVVHEGPQVELLADELGPVVETDGLGIAKLARDALECFDDIAATEVLPHIDRRREPGEGIDDGQDTESGSVEQLVVDKVHGPDLVGCRGRRAILAQLRLDPSLGRFVAQLQALLAIETADALGVDRPAFPPKQHMNSPITIANPGLGDLPDALDEGSLPGPLRTVVIGRPIHRHSAAGTTYAHPPDRANPIDHLTLPGRLHIFRRMTSCSISLSSDRSATSFFSRWFSSSSCFNRFISEGINPPYFLRQL